MKTALQGIKSLWSRTQANRRSHLAILASTSFYGDRMKEQALDKPADRFLQFWLHLHTNTEQNGCFLSSRVLRDWFQTSRETESVTVNDMFDFNSHQRQHIVKPCKKTSVPLQEMKYWLSCYDFTTLSCHVMLIIFSLFLVYAVHADINTVHFIWYDYDISNKMKSYIC